MPADPLPHDSTNRPSASDATGSKARRPWWRRWFIVLPASAALLFFPLVNLVLLLPWPKQRLIDAAGRSLGMPLQVERVTLWPWSGVALEHVRLGGDAGDPEATSRFHLPAVRIHPVWSSFVTSTWDIGEVEIESVEWIGAPGRLGTASAAVPPELPLTSPEIAGAPTRPGDPDPGISPTPPADPPADTPPRENPGPSGSPRETPRAAPALPVTFGRLKLADASLKASMPGGDELELLAASEVEIDIQSGRLTVGRIQLPGELETSGWEAELNSLPGGVLQAEGHAPGTDALVWRWQFRPGRAGIPFSIQIRARDLLLSDLFDRLPDWIEDQPSWINGEFIASGHAVQPSSVQGLCTATIENLALRLENDLSNQLGGREGGRFEKALVHSAGATITLSQRVLGVRDGFVKTPDGIGRTRGLIAADGRVNLLARLYASQELRDMLQKAVPELEFTRFEPTHWHMAPLQIGGSLPGVLLRPAHSTDAEWIPARQWWHGPPESAALHPGPEQFTTEPRS